MYVCTENPDVPNLKQGKYFPINVKSLSIPLRAHARTVTTTYRVVPTMQSSNLLCRFWLTLRNLSLFFLHYLTKNGGRGEGGWGAFGRGYGAFLITTFPAFRYL